MNIKPTYLPSSYNGPIKHKELPDITPENTAVIVNDCDMLVNQNMARISVLLKRLVDIDEKIKLLQTNM